MSGRAVPRLQLISQHLETSSFQPEIRRTISSQARRFSIARRLSQDKETPVKMSNQEPHAALLIPGPIEFEDEVLKSMSHYRYLASPQAHNQQVILTQSASASPMSGSRS